MGDKLSHKKGEEKGIWYEIKCTKDVVRNKETRGEDASFERSLLKAWAEYPGWEDARMGSSVATRSKSMPLKKKTNGKLHNIT